MELRNFYLNLKISRHKLFNLKSAHLKVAPVLEYTGIYNIVCLMKESTGDHFKD